MTEENMLMPEAISEKLKLAIALDNFEENFKNRTFSDRNPDKKTVNCPYCTKGRHQSPVCKARYVEGTNIFDSGKSFVKGRRVNPRLNQNKLLLLMRTRELFPKYNILAIEPLNAMRLARAEAYRSIRKERKAESKRKRDQQKRSRKINRRG